MAVWPDGENSSSGKVTACFPVTYAGLDKTLTFRQSLDETLPFRDRRLKRRVSEAIGWRGGEKISLLRGCGEKTAWPDGEKMKNLPHFRILDDSQVWPRGEGRP